MMRTLERLRPAALIITVLFLVSGCFSSDDGGGSQPETDTTLPEVVSTSPAGGATGVSRSAVVIIAFSEEMEDDSVEDNLQITGDISYSEDWSTGGDTLFLTPQYLVSEGASITIVVDALSEDMAGNQMGTDYQFTFTATSEADMSPPTVVSVSPANGSIDVSPGALIIAEFSEPIHQFHDWDTQTEVEMTPYPSDGRFEFIGNYLYIYHDPFPTETLVSISLTTDIADLAGNDMESQYSFSYTTEADDIKPYLASASPSNGATGVSTSLQGMNFTFSEPMHTDFDMPAENVDARILIAFADEPEWNGDFSGIDISLTRSLLPGCTYWVDFEGVTDMAGNLLDPNPTSYSFTTSGTRTFYPMVNGYSWFYFNEETVVPGRSPSIPEFDLKRVIENYSGGTGTFEEVFYNFDGSIQSKTFLQLSSGVIYHLGRAEYDEGVLDMTMTWDAPLEYIRLPIADHAGETWDFAGAMTVEGTVVVELDGYCTIQSQPVSIPHEDFRGSFYPCYVHHLYVTVSMYEGGILSGTDEVHQILYLAEGVGPVKMVDENDDRPGEPHVSLIYDWLLGDID